MREICGSFGRQNPWCFAKRSAELKAWRCCRSSCILLRELSPCCTSCVGGKPDYADPTLRAVALSRVAFLPTIRGKHSARKAQTIASSLVAKCVLSQQEAWFARVFRPAAEAGASPRSSGLVPAEVKVFTWQWDETSQRVRSMLPNKLRSERLSHAKVSVQIMMQSGLLSTFDVGEGCCALVSSHEWLCRGLMLGKQTADFILEGMAGAMPFFFDEEQEVLRLCEGASPLIVSLCCDRAAANFRACAWLWRQMASPLLRRRVLPHIEPCALHGVSLVKCRATGGKALIAAMASLGCLMRQWRFSNGLRDEILFQVQRKLRVRRALALTGVSPEQSN